MSAVSVCGSDVIDECLYIVRLEEISDFFEFAPSTREFSCRTVDIGINFLYGYPLFLKEGCVEFFFAREIQQVNTDHIGDDTMSCVTSVAIFEDRLDDFDGFFKSGDTSFSRELIDALSYQV